MTKAPDRRPDQIEVVEMDGKMWLQNGLTSDYVSVFLRSTPAREAAEELLEALEGCLKEMLGFAHDGFDGVWLESDFDDLAKPFRAAIARAKGEG